MTTKEIFADYFQIYLCDADHLEDWSAEWNDQTLDDRIVTLKHTAVFCTGRNMMVPVDIVIHAAPPDVNALAVAADHAVQGGIACASGALKLAGCTEYLPDAFTFEMRAGPVGVVFLSYDLDKIEPVERLEGEDRYALHVWPVPSEPETKVLKRWKDNAR
ncbi:MAG TPA: hypothetical protein PK970_14335 [Hyphomicrobiaceae bacterium]|nr:hypothetical protein [Hyphomicrobiaceae bacterium]